MVKLTLGAYPVDAVLVQEISHRSRVVYVNSRQGSARFLRNRQFADFHWARRHYWISPRSSAMRPTPSVISESAVA